MTANTKSGVPTLRFRPLRAADIDQLMELYQHAPWATERRKRDVARMLAGTPFTFSAWAGKRLVGFCRVLTDFVYRAVLYDVIIPADLQGRGVGRRLLERVLSHPKLKRIPSWYLKTADKHLFYEKLGWKHNGEEFMEFKR